jgi:glycine/D-amino acid oxidase-like deaminating enzyme
MTCPSPRLGKTKPGIATHCLAQHYAAVQLSLCVLLCYEVLRGAPPLFTHKHKPTPLVAVVVNRRRDVEPELYPRPDETVYVCGEPQSLPVPPGGPADVDVVETSCDTLRNIAGSLASCLRDAPVELRQSCFLPLTDDGEPAIGR